MVTQNLQKTRSSVTKFSMRKLKPRILTFILLKKNNKNVAANNKRKAFF